MRQEAGLRPGNEAIANTHTLVHKVPEFHSNGVSCPPDTNGLQHPRISKLLHYHAILKDTRELVCVERGGYILFSEECDSYVDFV